MQSEQLRALAAPRPVRSRDLHPFNGFYGHDAVLKAYAGLPERMAAKLVIEHGLDLTGLVPDIDRRLALPVHLCFSERRARELEAAIPGVEAVAIGPPIRYAEALADAPEESTHRRVVLFPAHSFDAGAADYDLHELLDTIAEYRAGFDETVACLYWPDVRSGLDGAYRKLGIESTTAGHLNDPRFLFRLLEILRGAAAVVTNAVGTHVVYAALLDRPVWVVPQEVRYRGCSTGVPADQARALDLLNRGGTELAAEVRRRFAEPRPELGAGQRAFAAELGGEPCLKSSAEIAVLFQRAEELFRERVGRGRRLALTVEATLRRR